MCGIVGRIGPGATDLAPALQALAHRGPDDRGTHRGRAGDLAVDLGFVRLAILDLSSNAHQPMPNEDESLWLVMNGEIYNYRELRRDLEGRGHVFRSASDSETILHAYEEWGDACLHALRGMFAFGLWDVRRERLLLVRDRLGIKPLFWSDRDGQLLFGSEMKALLALGAKRELDPVGLDGYLRHLYVPPPGTLFRGIQRLAPGHRLVWERGRIVVDRWWDIARPPEMRDEATLVEMIRTKLDEVVRQHLASDVPLGAFLSGGIDSSTIVALMARHASSKVRTFCVTFGEGEELYDERHYARAVAERFGTEHTEIPVQPNVVDLLPRMVHHFDEPFGNPTALLVFALSRATRQYVTVALAGDGGDEVFLGYPRYRGIRLGRRWRILPRTLRAGIARAVAPLIRESVRGDHRFRRAREFLSTGADTPELAYERWVTYFEPDDVDALVRPGLSSGSARSPTWIAGLFSSGPASSFEDRVSYVDLKSFLPENLLHYTDRMSMAHALEVRVPFCDHRLVELLAAVPFDQKMRHGRSKHLLREAMRGVLPDDVLDRQKVGFNPPMGLWLNRDLGPLVEERFEPTRLRREGMFDPVVVARMVEAHRARRRDYSLHIWALLVFQTWVDLYGVTA